MKLLVIEICNFEDYPTGGQLSFVRNMMYSFPEGSLKLVGCSTDSSVPVGEWTNRVIDGKTYRYFSVMQVNPSIEKPVMPKRLSAFFHLRKHIAEIIKEEYDEIFIQSPEVLFALPGCVLKKTGIDLPGLNNPLRFSRYRLLKPLAGPFEQMFYRRLKSVGRIWATACSSDIEIFVRNSPVCLPEVIQLPTRYDSAVFKPMSVCRESLGLNSNDTVIVTVGRLNRGKGWELMLEAFSVSGLSGCFIFIGNGEDENDIKKKAEELGISSRVILAGRKNLSEIALYLNAADLFVMGSIKEGWSTALVEACACGVPCVVTDFSSASDMIEDGKNGYVVRSRDSSEMAGKMLLALKLIRSEVILYDRRFEHLAVSNLPYEMYNV